MHSIRKCTTHNIEQLRAGFEVSLLPMTFQDAILVAHKLNIR